MKKSYWTEEKPKFTIKDFAASAKFGDKLTYAGQECVFVREAYASYGKFTEYEVINSFFNRITIRNDAEVSPGWEKSPGSSSDEV